MLSSSPSYDSSSSFQISNEKIYENYEINYLNESDLLYLNEIGHGRFSTVFRVVLPNGTIAAAKKLKPLEDWIYKREISIMEKLQNCPHVIQLIGVYGDQLSPVIVTDYSPSDSNTIPTYSDFKWAIKSLLSALNTSHYRHIFHRDVKWQNMLVSFKERRLQLIDWGLAEFVVKNKKYSPRTGTKSYKAPELLLGFEKYGPKVDLWAAGCVMANMMFGCPSFFTGHDNDAVLMRHVEFFGKVRMTRLAKRYDGDVANGGKRKRKGYNKKKRRFPSVRRQSFLEYALPHTRHLITNESLEMLGMLLSPEMEYRPSAADALTNPFFSE